jgi:hypothetical protein
MFAFLTRPAALKGEERMLSYQKLKVYGKGLGVVASLASGPFKNSFVARKFV